MVTRWNSRWSHRLTAVWCRYAPAVLVLLGAEIRVRQWLGARSLWLDEATMADNLFRRSYADLLQPLDHSAGGPVLWLWAERAAVEFYGQGERALRLVPLVAGVLVLAAMWLVARELLPPPLVPVAVALTALSPALVYYSNEVKPYESDVLACLLLVYAGIRIIRTEAHPAWLVTWAVGGSVAVASSIPATFAVAGVGTILLAHAIWAGRSVLAVAAATAVPAGAFGFLYLTVLRHLTDDGPLQQFWQFSYPRQDGGAGELAAWPGRVLRGFVDYPLELRAWPLAVAVLAAGSCLLLRRNATPGLLVPAVVPFVLVAGALRAYPPAWRLVLFAVPLGILTVTAAMSARNRVLQLVAAAAVGVVALPPAAATARYAVHAQHREEIRPAMAWLAREMKPDDLVLVSAEALPTFRLYRDVGLYVPRDGVLVPTRGEPGCPLAERFRNAKLPAQRTWLLLGAGLPSDPGANPYLVGQFRVHRSYVVTGAAAYLVTPQPGPPVPGRCLKVVKLLQRA